MPPLDKTCLPALARGDRRPPPREKDGNTEGMPRERDDEPLRLREAVVLVRLAGWTAMLRGLGIALATITGAMACQFAHRSQGFRLAAGALLATSLLLFSRGVLRRHAPSGLSLASSSLLWVILLCMDLPRVLRLGGAFEVASLRAEPIVLIVFPGWLLPELFTVFALLRRDGRTVLRPSTALPPALDVPPWRLSGRTLAAHGLVVLALLSSALLCIFGPGALLTLT